MMEAYDREGYAVWLQVMKYIAKLGPERDSLATCH